MENIEFFDGNADQTQLVTLTVVVGNQENIYDTTVGTFNRLAKAMKNREAIFSFPQENAYVVLQVNNINSLEVRYA